MRCDNLDVLHGAAAIAVLVLEPGIGQLDVPILTGQLMLLSPSRDCLSISVDCFSPLTARSVLDLKEPLIFPLQVLFEHHASDGFAAFDVPLGGLHVRAVNTRIVRKLTRLRDADIEGLTGAACIRPSAPFEK